MYLCLLNGVVSDMCVYVDICFIFIVKDSIWPSRALNDYIQLGWVPLKFDLHCV